MNQTVQTNNDSKPQVLSTPNVITGPINYVAVGDSTGVGVGAREGGYVARLFRRMLQRRPASKLTNLCLSGATTADVLDRQMDRATSANANLITLSIGINDIGHGFTADQFAKNFEEIITGLQKTNATIVVTNVPDISSAPRLPVFARSEYQRVLVEFNRRLEEIAARHGVVVFDVYSLTHEQLPGHPEYFSTDGFHPSDKGYELWAESMWPVVAKAIGVEP